MHITARRAAPWRLLALLFLLLCACVVPAHAREQHIEVQRYEVRYTLRDDATYKAHHLMQIKVLSEKALDSLRTSNIWHSASVESSTVIKAYTLKADGSTIDVPKDNFQKEVRSGLAGKPAFSDNVRITVIFPQLQVGDATYLEYEIDTKEAIFPGHFSLWQNLSPRVPYGKALLSIDAPAQLQAQYGSKGVQQQVQEANGRKIITWVYSNPKPQEDERTDFSVYDPQQEPYVAYTTFTQHSAIAQAYGVRATPKAQPTARVRELAAQITTGAQSPYDKARAIYDWVAQKIDYAGNCIGVGVVVPRDLDFVLDNKMGDCKDHATLLQALLQAQGIASTQVLVNAGNVYTLPSYPVVSMVNHVLNYIPSLNVYADATSSTTPFGMLPLQVQGKPLLRVEGHSEGLRAPHIQPGVNTQQFQSVLEIDAQGNAKGKMQVKHTGLFAAEERARHRNWPEEERKKYFAKYFEAMQLQGASSIETEDPQPLRDTFSYTLQYQVQHMLDEGGGTLPLSLFSTSVPVESFVSAAYEDNPADDALPFACSNGSSSEQYQIKLPANIRIVTLPKDVTIDTPYLRFEARYSLAQRVLKVSRKLEDRSPGGVCSPEVGKSYKAAARAVAKHLRGNILYQFK